MSSRPRETTFVCKVDLDTMTAKCANAYTIVSELCLEYFERESVKGIKWPTDWNAVDCVLYHYLFMKGSDVHTVDTNRMVNQETIVSSKLKDLLVTEYKNVIVERFLRSMIIDANPKYHALVMATSLAHKKEQVLIWMILNPWILKSPQWITKAIEGIDWIEEYYSKGYIHR